jgi:hypothetical protein
MTPLIIYGGSRAFQSRRSECLPNCATFAEKIFRTKQTLRIYPHKVEISKMSQQDCLIYATIPEMKAGIGGPRSPIPGVFLKIGGDAPLLLYGIC